METIQTEKKTLNLGCGELDFHDAFNVDILDTEIVDLVWDLNKLPWPITDEQFETTKAIDIVEHLEEPLKIMEEIWRVTKVGGIVDVRVPDWEGMNAWTDLTHKRPFTVKSMDYFDPSTEFGKKYAYYSHARFRILSSKIDGGDIVFKLKRLESEVNEDIL